MGKVVDWKNGRVWSMKFVELPCCEKIYPTDANFFLAKVTDAEKIYNYLVGKGIIVRNRTILFLYVVIACV